MFKVTTIWIFFPKTINDLCLRSWSRSINVEEYDFHPLLVTVGSKKMMLTLLDFYLYKSKHCSWEWEFLIFLKGNYVLALLSVASEVNAIHKFSLIMDALNNLMGGNCWVLGDQDFSAFEHFITAVVEFWEIKVVTVFF